MSEQARVNLHLAPSVRATLITLTEETGMGKGQVVTQALDLYRRAREATRAGQHVGAVDNPKTLDRFFLGAA